MNQHAKIDTLRNSLFQWGKQERRTGFVEMLFEHFDLGAMELITKNYGLTKNVVFVTNSTGSDRCIITAHFPSDDTAIDIVTVDHSPQSLGFTQRDYHLNEYAFNLLNLATFLEKQLKLPPPDPDLASRAKSTITYVTGVKWLTTGIESTLWAYGDMVVGNSSTDTPKISADRKEFLKGVIEQIHKRCLALLDKLLDTDNKALLESLKERAYSYASIS